MCEKATLSGWQRKLHPQSNTSKAKPFLQRCLDAFATRLGLALTMGTGCAVCICAGLYFQFGANRLLASHETFRQSHMRDSFVTISDTGIGVALLCMD